MGGPHPRAAPISPGVIVVGVAAHQGKPLAGHGETAEAAREVAAHLDGQAFVAHGGQRPDAGRAVIPDQGAMLARQRQEGARPLGVNCCQVMSSGQNRCRY